MGLGNERQASAVKDLAGKSAVRGAAWVSLGLVAVLLLGSYPVLFSFFARMLGDPGDPRLTNLILENTYQAVIERSHGLWDARIFYPTPNTAAYTELLLGSAPIYWVIRLCGQASDTAYQLWILIVLGLDYLAFYYWLTRCFGYAPLPSAVGALLFAAGAPRTGQNSHQQLFAQFFTIGALYALFRIFTVESGRDDGRRGGWIAAFVLLVAAQFYAGFYLGWLFCLTLLLAAIVTLGRSDLRSRALWIAGRNRRAIALALLLGLATIGPLFVHYRSVVPEIGEVTFDDIEAGVPHLQSWLFLGQTSRLYGWMSRVSLWQRLAIPHEHSLGVGFLTTAVAIAGLYRNRGIPAVGIASATALLTIAITTAFPRNLAVWPYLYRILPGAAAIRALSRIGLVVAIVVALGVAGFLQSFMQSIGGTLLPAILVTGIILEQTRSLPSYDKLLMRSKAQTIAAKLDGARCSFFYFSPRLHKKMRDEDMVVMRVLWQLDAMQAAVLRGIPTVNGYSGHFPSGWEELAANEIVVKADARRLRAALTTWLKTHGLDAMDFCWVRMAGDYEY